MSKASLEPVVPRQEYEIARFGALTGVSPRKDETKTARRFRRGFPEWAWQQIHKIEGL